MHIKNDDFITNKELLHVNIDRIEEIENLLSSFKSLLAGDLDKLSKSISLYKKKAENFVKLGSLSQTKTGSFSVEVFTAAQNASFNNQMIIKDRLIGKNAAANPFDSYLKFGGEDNDGVSRKANLNINGKLSINNSSGRFSGTIASNTLANSTLRPVCADSSGKIILCSQTNSGGGGASNSISSAAVAGIGYTNIGTPAVEQGPVCLSQAPATDESYTFAYTLSTYSAGLLVNQQYISSGDVIPAGQNCSQQTSQEIYGGGYNNYEITDVCLRMENANIPPFQNFPQC